MKNSIKKITLALLLATIITPNAWGETFEGGTNGDVDLTDINLADLADPIEWTRLLELSETLKEQALQKP